MNVEIALAINRSGVGGAHLALAEHRAPAAAHDPSFGHGVLVDEAVDELHVEIDGGEDGASGSDTPIAGTSTESSNDARAPPWTTPPACSSSARNGIRIRQ